VYPVVENTKLRGKVIGDVFLRSHVPEIISACSFIVLTNVSFKDCAMVPHDIPDQSQPGLWSYIRFPDSAFDIGNCAAGNTITNTRIDDHILTDAPFILSIKRDQPVIKTLVAMVGLGHVRFIVQGIIGYAAGVEHIPVAAASFDLEADLEVVRTG